MEVINNEYVSKKRNEKEIEKWTKIQKVYHQRVSTGKWGVMKKHT